MTKVKFGLRLLETLTSALYDNSIVIFREYVQNSVDAYNRALENNSKRLKDFSVDITIDKKNSTITIHDNGYGIIEKEFEQKMKNIGVDTKSDSFSQIGFRGIGRLSAIPFCDSLVFTNKQEGSEYIHRFTWDGRKFNDLLMNDSEIDFNKAFDTITSLTSIKYAGAKKEHFFTVEIQNYNEEIKQLICHSDFEYQLSTLLPLNYSNDFTYKAEIKKRFNKLFNSNLDDLAFNVTLNKKSLSNISISLPAGGKS